jgi:hypothetical protein
MKFGIAVLAAFLGALLAIAFVLAWRSSQETGKSIPASLTDVPGEAQKVYSDAKSRATTAVNTGKETYQKAGAAVKGRFTGGEEPVAAEEA